ncbi:MAG: hypothetical protein NZR01_11425 [Bryobacteraceae bacterium]|nr:hypothetical protein [Bryobacteraceae bacterium]
MTRRSSEFCLSAQEIEDCLFNRLSGVTREAVEEHLLFCQSCLAKVEEEERYIEAARSAAEKLEAESLLRQLEGHSEGGQPSRQPGRLPRWMAAAAAGALLLIGGSVTYRIMHPAPALQVELRVERSGVLNAQTPVAGQRLILSPDLRGLPPLSQYRWSIVDSLGVPVAGGMMEVRAETGRIELQKGLPAGMYWVRLLDPDSGVLLREFALMVRTKGQ